MKRRFLSSILLLASPSSGVRGFAVPGPTKQPLAPIRSSARPATQGVRVFLRVPASNTNEDDRCNDRHRCAKNDDATVPSLTANTSPLLIPHFMALAACMVALPAYASIEETASMALSAAGGAPGVIPTALWAYAHYLSILAISACLAAERTLVKAGMTVDEENTIVKLDLVYGLMAALLIGSGFARASNFGKGGDFYIHDILFWVKMSVSGIWGGLSLFPSLTFYKRNFARKNNEAVPPVSTELAGRLQQVINAEISAILSIPLLATLMSRGVWYWDDFPWPVGLVISVLATGGSFYFYARQALTWKEVNGAGLTEE